MKEHHKVEVIEIKEVRPHGNADKLEIIPIDGYQAVVAKGQFKVGDLAYYVPPDSVVPESRDFEFLWAPNTYVGGVPERKRRITAKKLRGEWSEGLLMPIRYLDGDFKTGPTSVANSEGKEMRVKVGDNVAEFLGIYHYNPPEPGEQSGSTALGQPKPFRWPKTFNGWKALIVSWFRGERREAGISLPTYDVDAFKKFQNVFQPGEEVLVTEKIHGSNARFSFQKNWLGQGKFYVGSRNLWKAPTSACVWRRAVKDNPWIEMWCRQHPGYALYGEVTPTQKGYDYGAGDKVRFFLFDVRKPNGKWAELEEISTLMEGLEGKGVPVLHRGPFDLENIRKLVDGPSTVSGAKHIKEGVVIRSIPERYVSSLGRAQLKWVSNVFLERENK
jgi:tRNA-binding EMAP/Myf-like protein